MTTEVLTQLQALREKIAETLRKDPRYLTLAALDKSITEISGVLAEAGIDLPALAKAAPMHFESAPAAAPQPAAPAIAPPVAAAQPEPAPAAPYAIAAAPERPMSASASAPPPAAPVASAAAPVAPAVPPVKKKKKKSVLKPLVATAAALAVAGIAAEVMHESHGKKAAEPTPEKDEPEKGASEDDDPAEAKHASPEKEQPDADETEDKADEDAGGDHKAEDKGDDDKTDEEKGDEDKADDAVIPKGKASGYTPMQPKPGVTQYQPAMSVKFGKLPNKVDLRSLMTPIEDQGDTSSCVANAVAGAYEYWIKKASKQDHNISRLFVYYNARWRDASQDKDDGSVIQLAMEGLSKFGACNEKVWPFDPHLILKKPGADAYQDAAPYKVHDMAQVPLKLEAWKQALAEGKPIVFGCELFDSFDECSKRGGVVPMPAPDDIARKKHSGHSMCAVGYSDTENVFIVRNSWGADWGDKGYCYMPYAYLMSDKFNDGDCWVFIPKVPSQPPREVWSDDTTPVTNGGVGVTFPIETYTIADYQKITVDLFEKIRKPFNGVVLESFSNYVSLAGKGLWSEMESFDFKTFLASTAALAGVAAVASEFSSTSVSSETVSSTSETLADKESDEEQDKEDDNDSDESGDEDSDSEEDGGEDSDSDEDGDEDSDSDEDGDEDSDSDEDGDEDSDSEEDGDEDSDSDEDGDEDSDSDEDGDEDSDSDEDGDEDSDSDEDGDEDSDSDEDGDEDSDSDEDGDEDSDSDEDGDEDSDSDEDGDEDSDSDEDGGDDDDGGGDDGGGDDD